MKELILTLISEDRPGIVDKVASVIHLHDGSWMESRMTQMAGKFVGIVRVTCPIVNIDAMTGALADLSEAGIRITVEEGQTSEISTETYVAVNITANDRLGIVREVANCLAALNINLEDLQTDCSTAAMSSSAMFHASFLTVIPEDVTVEDVIAALESLSDDLMVDIDSE